MSAETQTVQLVVVDRSLAIYTRAFYDAVTSALSSPPSGAIIVSSASSAWFNPWQESELSPRVARLVHIIPAPFSWPRGTVWPRWKIWTQLNYLAPTLVIVREYNPYTLFAFVWAKFHRVKVVISTDVGFGFQLGTHTLSISQKIIHRLANHMSDGIIACTRTAERLATSLKKRCIMAPHAVDSSIFSPEPSTKRRHKTGKIKILQVSGFFYWKGIDLLLEAFALALFQDERLELRIIGSGDYSPYYQLTRTLGINDRVAFSGFKGVETLVAAYRSSDFFTLSSRTDTLGVVAHEAACCGLPLLISRHAGASEVFLEEGVNGYSVNPFDAMSFAERILELARDPDLRYQMGRESRRIGEKWCVSSNAVKTAVFLQSLLTNNLR